MLGIILVSLFNALLNNISAVPAYRDQIMLSLLYIFPSIQKCIFIETSQWAKSETGVG